MGVCRFGEVDREDEASAGFRVSSISRFEDLRTSPSRSSLSVPYGCREGSEEEEGFSS